MADDIPQASSSQRTAAPKLSDTIDLVPESLLAGKQRRDLRKLASALDNAVRVEKKTGQFKVHEPTLRGFFRDPELFGPGFDERAIANLRHGDVLITDDHGTEKALWAQYLQRSIGVDFPGNRGLQPDAFSSSAKLETEVRNLYPELPAKAMDGTTMKQALDRFVAGSSQSQIIEATQEADPVSASLADFGSWWDCVKRQYARFWIGVVGFALMCFVLTFPNLALGAFFAGLWLGGTALLVGLNCLLNPYG